MSEKKKEGRAAELDDFWNIDALIPQKRAPHYPHDVEAAEIVIEPAAHSASPRNEAIPEKKERGPIEHFIPPHAPDRVREALPDEEYFPENSLLRVVRLYREKEGYHYYEDFVRAAERLLHVRGVECPHVPFFSYVPQYSQMTRGQLEWYLWWRQCQRDGKVLTTDYSYLLLYAYEIINLGSRMNVVEGRDALCRLWLEYREIFHQLDGYLPNWICDYSLIHRLQPPKFERQTLFAAMSRCALKEFYLTATGREGLVRALPSVCSDYDYHKSKFYTKEHAALYEKHIHGALFEVFSKHEKDAHVPHLEGGDTSRMVRASYNGALCAYSTKRKIALEYTSFYASHDLRLFVTEVIKHTENQIRAHLGIRSRLSVTALAPSVRATIEQYLVPFLPRRQRENAISATGPEPYEKLYDLPRAPLDLSRAHEIERASWNTTERLIEAFEDGEEEKIPTPPKVQIEVSMAAPAIEEAGAANQGAWQPYLPFLAAVLAKNAFMQSQIAKEEGRMPEVLADEINALAAECFGDILIEDSDDGYTVIEDYISEAEALLKDKKDG